MGKWEGYVLFFWLFMEELNDDFDAKITVFKNRKLTIVVSQI